jgi:hypothetical protein
MPIISFTLHDLRGRRFSPPAERYCIFILYFVFALYERKNEIQVQPEVPC